jgi:hypothetical protein
MATTLTTPALFWSEGGEIACKDHAPYAGSDTRVSGRWRKITRAEASAFAREVGRPVACETCVAIERRKARA